MDRLNTTSSPTVQMDAGIEKKSTKDLKDRDLKDRIGVNKIFSAQKTDLEKSKSAPKIRSGFSDPRFSFLYKKVATSSDESRIKVIASPNAPVGDYTVTVNQLGSPTIALSDKVKTGALGYKGSFMLNGAKIFIEESDSASIIAKKISQAKYAEGLELVAVVIDSKIQIRTKSLGASSIFSGDGKGHWIRAEHDPDSILSGLGILNKPELSSTLGVSGSTTTVSGWLTLRINGSSILSGNEVVTGSTDRTVSGTLAVRGSTTLSAISSDASLSCHTYGTNTVLTINGQSICSSSNIISPVNGIEGCTLEILKSFTSEPVRLSVRQKHRLGFSS